jgi:hypothetical protein
VYLLDDAMDGIEGSVSDVAIGSPVPSSVAFGATFSRREKTF